MHKRARRIVTTFIVVVACLVGFLPSGPSAQEQCTWEIGVMGALSGNFAYLGQPILNGIEMAVAEANEAGELACTLEVVAQDSQGDPSQAPPLAQDLAERERLVACLCGFFSGETLASGSILSDAGILMASTGSHPSMDDQGFETWFRAVANDVDVAARGAVYIKRALQARRVALVRDTQDRSKIIARQVENRLGWRVQTKVIINEGANDYSAAVAHIRNARPDLVVYGGYAREAGLLLKQLRRGGVRTDYMAIDMPPDREFERTAGSHAHGALGACNCSIPEQLGPDARSFAARFQERYGRAPRSYAGDMYDITNLVVEALTQHERGTPIETIRESVVRFFHAATQENGVIKPYTWERDGELRARGRHVFIFRHAREHWRMLGSVYNLVRH